MGRPKYFGGDGGSSDRGGPPASAGSPASRRLTSSEYLCRAVLGFAVRATAVVAGGAPASSPIPTTVTRTKPATSATTSATETTAPRPRLDSWRRMRFQRKRRSRPARGRVMTRRYGSPPPVLTREVKDVL